MGLTQVSHINAYEKKNHYKLNFVRIEINKDALYGILLSKTNGGQHAAVLKLTVKFM